MKRKLVLGSILLCGLSMTLLSQSAIDKYQRALVQEQAAGNLKEAIALYRQAAAEAGSDRALAARALFRAAGAEEKMAEPHAVETYAELLRSYAEQPQVAAAQARLAALRATTGAAAPQREPASSAIPAVVDRALKTYCMDCHTSARPSGNLNLEAMGAKPIAENAARWETLLQRLRARRDPPSGMARPDDSAYQTMISTLEVALDQAYPQNASLATAPRVDDLELADRMAGFIWGKDSKPDDELTAAARRGALRNTSGLEQQVKRMLRDARSSALVETFLERWMLRGGPEQLSAAGRRSASLDEELRQAFATETRMFLQSQLRDDRGALELWTANYTFANERLARFYGLSGVSGSDFRRVNLAGAERGGILGQGSLLTVTSMAERTSPTVRGMTVMRLFTGMNPPDPPPNVPALRSDSTQPDRPMREVLAQHISVPACVSCHRTFDPWGLALENFNLIGAYRRTQGGSNIDATGAFTDGTPFTGPADFRTGLLKYRDAYYTGMTQALFGYALGRQGMAWRVHEYEMPTVRAIVREAGANDYRWSALVTGIVGSTSFQLKTLVP